MPILYVNMADIDHHCDTWCSGACWYQSINWHDVDFQTDNNTYHYSDVTWCLKSLATQLFIQQLVQSNNNEKDQSSALLALCEGNPLNFYL